MTVELHSAFVWDCDECGKENFERAIEGGMEESAIEEAANEIDTHLVATGVTELDDEQEMAAEALTQKIVVAPAFVTCKHCGVSVDTEISHMDDDESDDE